MDGKIIAQRMGIENGSGAWVLKSCAVVEVENDFDCKMFKVYMGTDKGSISMQTVTPADDEDCEQCRESLDRGESPVGAWEDGNAMTVRPGNGVVVDGCVVITTSGLDEFVTDVGPSMDGAVQEAKDVWEHLSNGDKRTHTVMACMVDERYVEGVIKDILWSSEDDTVLTDAQIQEVAANLFDGGWRSSDRDEIMDEYDLSDGEADRMVEALKGIEGKTLSEWHGTKPVRVSGTSKVIAVTEACKALGVQDGEYVEVTIRRM